MLRTTGSHRTYQHNLRLAALLCLTAGLVNVVGFIGFMVLTTNVTGHVAMFADMLAQGKLMAAAKVGIWMAMFFAGAFFCSLYIGKIGRDNSNAYTLPILIEIAILAAVGLLAHNAYHAHHTKYFAGGLLFAMGLQNALVTMISGSVVRTTHLTGMFTDLGIELSALFYADEKEKKEYHKKILLHSVIVSTFITGGVLGGYLYSRLDFYTLFIPVTLLVVVLFYDAFRERLGGK